MRKVSEDYENEKLHANHSIAFRLKEENLLINDVFLACEL